MKTLEIDQLQEHLIEAIGGLSVGETIDITNQGQVIARLVPVLRPLTQEEIEEDLARLDAMAAEIGKYVTEPTNAAELLSQMRR